MRKYYTQSKREEYILSTAKTRKANWIGHILRRNCFIKHVIEVKVEGMIEVTEGGERRGKQLLDELRVTEG